MPLCQTMVPHCEPLSSSVCEHISLLNERRKEEKMERKGKDRREGREVKERDEQINSTPDNTVNNWSVPVYPQITHLFPRHTNFSFLRL